MRHFLIMAVAVLFLFNCNSKQKDSVSYGKSETVAQPKETHPGKKLLETQCYVCHSPTASHDNRIGPPMIAIKRHYISEHTTKEEFVKDMQAWIKNPNAADAKMKGAVKRFGVMPKQYFPEETIAQIADYMYTYELEQPDWFQGHMKKGKDQGKGKHGRKNKAHKNQEASTNSEDLSIEDRGLKYALGTKAVLGKNLMGTIQKKGTDEALAFCNVKAYPLTDSMAVVYNSQIKRVTDQPRNPSNQANSSELEFIKTFKNQVADKKAITPLSETVNGKAHVYYPIVTNTMCLQCHGQPNKDIQPSTLSKIKLLYPNDKAVGYTENQVRGMWHVTFNSNK